MMKKLNPCTWHSSILVGLLAVSVLALLGQARFFWKPAPEPVAPPPGPHGHVSLLDGLTRSQSFSASRVSSYQRQGGPRDNVWIPTDGTETTLAEIKGPGAITHIWTTHRDGGHELIVRMYWEGSEHPSVEAPIGDFFGVAMDAKATLNSAPIQVSSEGRSRNCWWHMPFNRSARVTVTATRSPENRKRETVPLYFYIDYRVYAEPIPDIHYFHARFRETDPPVRGQPITLLEAEGDGHFVGVVMGHRARMDGWFGEGDDIITVDGQVAAIGTGTEDYFCDAWGFRVFSYPYYGVPLMEGREVGSRLSAYRFHLLDPVPFRKTFKLEIEHWPWISPLPNTGRGHYSSVGFWYQKSIHSAWPRLTRLLSHAPWDPDKGRWHVAGALEGEALAVSGFRSQTSSTKPEVHKVLPNLSGDHMLVFDTGGDGELSLAVPVEQAGTYTLEVHLARAPDYGIVAASINGKSVGNPIDTFLKKDDLTRPLWPPKAHRFPGVTLPKGASTLRLSVKAKHPKSEGYKIGLDCIVVK